MFFDFKTLFLIGLVLMLSAVAIMLHRSYIKMKNQKRKIAEHQRADRAAQKLRDQRTNLGGRIYNALVAAARENPTGMAVVERWPDNDGSYSVGIRFNERTVFCHEQAAFQVSIKFAGETGRELHVLEGKYGPDYYYPATEESVESVLHWLKEKTRRWGVDGEFPKKAA